MHKRCVTLRAKRPRSGMVAAIAAITAVAAQASVTVENVAFTQDEATHDVTVTYELTTGDGEPAFVSLDVLTNGVSVGATHVKKVSGDVSTTPADTASLVAPGTDKRIIWKARADLPGVGLDNAKVRVTAIATNHYEGIYLVVDLARGTNTVWYPVQYTACKPDTNSPAFYTTELWLRRVPAGTFKMGYSTSGNTAPVRDVTLTKDFYCGVLPVTVAQHRLMDDLPEKFNHDDAEHDRHPVTHTVYSNLRGTSWPSSAVIATDKSIAKIRSKTALSFDLPTEAQWEYACRAGHSGNTLNDGSSASNNGYQYLGWGQVNSGNTTHPVALLKPSSWDFYDFYGNVYEWTKDYISTGYDNTDTIDPKGAATPSTSGQRVRRGGSYGSNQSGCNSYYRNGLSQTSDTSANAGYRLVVDTEEGDPSVAATGADRGSADSTAGYLETRPGIFLAGIRYNSEESYIDTATPLSFVMTIR